jgi:release factor glutamine methyltransferase
MHFAISGHQLRVWSQQAQQRATAAGVDPQEVNWLLDAVGVNRLQLRLDPERDQPLTVAWEQLQKLWDQRLQDRIPVQYLVGKVPWRHFVLQVSPEVLIPRPETEYMIDLAQKAVQESTLPDLAQGHWVDLGTGSGAIAIGLAEIFPDATIHAVDQSAEALELAQTNAQTYAPHIHFYQGSWWQPLTHRQGEISGMVSNPPYIPSHLIPQLQPEVAHHEPHKALDGGEDGLDAICHLIATAPLYLRPGGVWLVELMAGQGQTVATLLEQHPAYTKVQIFNDFAGRDRFVLAYCYLQMLP